MRTFLACVIALCASVALADTQDADAKSVKKEKSKASKAVRKVEVTGSKIPMKVDKHGQPVDSTLTVGVISSESIRVWGAGSPLNALERVPYVYIRGRR